VGAAFKSVQKNLFVVSDKERNDDGDDVVAEVKVRSSNQQLTQTTHSHRPQTLNTAQSHDYKCFFVCLFFYLMFVYLLPLVIHIATK